MVTPKRWGLSGSEEGSGEQGGEGEHSGQCGERGLLPS